MSEHDGLLCCPCCNVALEIRINGLPVELETVAELDVDIDLVAIPRPFRTATLESVFGAPNVRTPPQRASSITVTCGHCGDEFHPARGTKHPRYCTRSCARRAKLAAKHGFTREMYELARDMGLSRAMTLEEAAVAVLSSF